MRKSRLISVRVPVDVLDRLDDMLKKGTFLTRSDVICIMLEIATDTLLSSQLNTLRHASEYFGNPITELHIKFGLWGIPKSVDYVRECRKSADD